MKKIKKLAVVLLCLSLFICGCTNSSSSGSSSDTGNTSVSSGTDSESSVSSNEASGSEIGTTEQTETVSVPESDSAASISKQEELAQKRIAYIMETSLQSTGNNSRLKKVIEKARSGETVNLAALGGSITEGAGANSYHEGYAYIFADAFKETYCSNDNLNYVNAGLSGTPSALAVMRYETNVVEELGCVPDLLIIEFAVNDYGEVTKGRALESLIYQALTANEDCAVILLFSVSSAHWSCDTDMAVTGRYYNVPMVNMKRVLDTGLVADKDYFFDDYHPSPYGHQLTSDCLMNLLAAVDSQEKDDELVIPEDAKYGRDFTDMKLALPDSGDVKITIGSFDKTDSAVQTLAFKKKLSFPDNFMHTSDSGSKALKFKLTASHILISYKTASSTEYGEAEIYVDGKLVTTLNSYSASGWNNCNVDLILDEKEAKSHTVEIKMKKGSESKKFTLLGLAYN